jgi:hypothetical protein
MDNVSFYNSIKRDKLPDAVRTELEELYKDTAGFSDSQIVEIEQENIDELFRIIREHPEAVSEIEKKSEFRITSVHTTFIPQHQIKYLRSLDKGGREELASVLSELEAQLKSIPSRQSVENQDDYTVHAHYFTGSTDIFVLEHNKQDNTIFTFTILNGDTDNAELGDASLAELTSTKRLELDFYWKPVSLGEAKSKAYPEIWGKSDPEPNPSEKEGKGVKYKVQKVKKSAAPEPKKVKKVKRDPAPEKTESTQKGTGVEEISKEVYFIKRAVNMHGKEKQVSSLLTLIRSLQKSIMSRVIRKTSPLAAIVQEVQEKLVKAYNIAVEEDLSVVTLNFKDSDLTTYVTAAGGERIFDSIRLIKRFVGLQGKPLKNLEGFLKQLKKVDSEDPYFDRILGIIKKLEKATEGSVLEITPAQLSGLNGVVSGFGGLSGVVEEETVLTPVYEYKGYTIKLPLMSFGANKYYTVRIYKGEKYVHGVKGPAGTSIEKASAEAERMVDKLIGVSGCTQCGNLGCTCAAPAKNGVQGIVKKISREIIKWDGVHGVGVVDGFVEISTNGDSKLQRRISAFLQEKGVDMSGVRFKKAEGFNALSGIDQPTFLSANSKVEGAKGYLLPGEIGKLIQRINPFRYAIALTGPKGGGKTQVTFQIADAFATAIRRGEVDSLRNKEVAMFSLEQGGLESLDTQEALDRHIKPENRSVIKITGEKEKGIDSIKSVAESGAYGVIIIDSWQKLNAPSTRMDELRQEFPDIVWVVIFQQNSEGGTRGGVASEYDANVVLKIHKVDKSFVRNWVELDKNRGNGLNRHYMIAAKKTVEGESPETVEE